MTPSCRTTTAWRMMLPARRPLDAWTSYPRPPRLDTLGDPDSPGDGQPTGR